MKVIQWAVLASLITASCRQSTPSLTTAEHAAIIDSVSQTLERYYADIRKQGLTAEFNYLNSSSDFFWVPPGYTGPISYDSVAFVLRQRAPVYRLIENVWDTLIITPLTKELTSYTGRLTSVMTDTAGSTSHYELVETGLLIKRANGWKLLSGQTSILE